MRHVTGFALLMVLANPAVAKVCDLGAGVAEVAPGIVLQTQPSPGFGVVISRDYTKWRRLAPVLDRASPDFHEGDAIFWQTNFLKAATVAMTRASPALKAGLTDLGSHNGPRNLRAMTPRGDIDVFVRRYILAGMDAAERFRSLVADTEALCASNMAPQVAASELRRMAQKLRGIMYEPLLPWTPQKDAHPLQNDPRFLRRAVHDALEMLAARLNR